MTRVNASGKSKLQIIEEPCQTIFSTGSFVQKEALHILHVDDDTSLLQVSKMILETENNFLIERANSVDEAFTKMKTRTYDAIICDYEMPLKNGLEFLKELKEQNRDIPFILFTGKGREDVAVKALNLGADSYVNKNGSPETVYCELADAIGKSVERKRSRKLLAESEYKYRKLVERSIQGIMIAQGFPPQVGFANASIGKMLGYSSEEFTSLSPAEVAALIYYEDRTLFFNHFRNRLEGKQDNSSFEFRAVRKDGLIIWLEAFGIRIEYDRQPAVQATFLDITERKKAQEALYFSEEKFRAYVENSPVAFFVANSDGNYEQVNEAACNLLGYCRNELLKMNIFNVLFEELIPFGVEQFAYLKENGKSVMEIALKRKDGRPVYVILNSVKLPDGKLMAFCENFTERKKTEEALVKSEENYRNLINGMSESVWVIDFEGNLIDINNASVEMLAYCREELLSLGIKGIDKYLNSKQVGDLMSRVVSGKTQVFETEHTTKDGKKIPVEISSSLITYHGKQAVLSIARNITERKKQEYEIESLARFPSENPNPIFRISGKGKILYANEAATSLLTAWNSKLIQQAPDQICKLVTDALTSKMRIEIEETYGAKTFSLLFAPVSLEDYVNIYATEITERKKAEEVVKFQADLLNDVGQAIIMADNDRTIRFWNKAAEKLFGWSKEQALGHEVPELLGMSSPEEIGTITERLKSGESWSTEALAKNKDGSTVPIILNRTPIFKENGEYAGAASIATDITLQKNTEVDLTFSLVSLSHSLDKIEELNEKLRVVGGLTRHDVRNKLSTVSGYAYILKKRHKDQMDIVEGLDKMEQALKDSVKIFDFAKLYEQLGEKELVYVNVEEKLNEAISLFSGLIPTIMNECHGLTVLADSFLSQLFYNFMDNTRKYGKKATSIRGYYERTETGELRLIYEDNGVGIFAGDKPKLFMEGFSTGGSTGFGLFFIKKMMEVYGWAIQETGEPGKNAKFIMTIPRLNKNGKDNFQIA
ncbi:MAG: PAS domain S-box protein [Candidatus Bathyarchaeia archaeon]|jgi:PAS domain S-box-containing protein